MSITASHDHAQICVTVCHVLVDYGYPGYGGYGGGARGPAGMPGMVSPEEMDGRAGGPAGGPGGPPSANSFLPSVTVRKFFPETWLWDLINTEYVLSL